MSTTASAKGLLVEGEPLVLADGTVILPDNSIQKKAAPTETYVDVPTNSAAQKLVLNTRRKLTDLPASSQQLNIIAACCMYEMYGLSDAEIATALQITSVQVRRIKAHDAYSRLKEDTIESLLSAQRDNVRSLIKQAAPTAVQKVIALTDSEDDKVALMAAKDILDRDGHRPVDVVEHRHSMDATFKIEFIHKDGFSELPSLEGELAEDE